MVLVGALSLDVEVHLGSIANGLEEVHEHLSGHFANLLAMELSIPDEPGAPTEVECHLTQTVVHRQAVAIALYATLVAESLQQTLAKHYARILDGVVLVNLKVALTPYI